MKLRQAANDASDAVVKLIALSKVHRELDDRIFELQKDDNTDQFQIKRLKKQKLVLKDNIQILQNSVRPDIIA